MNTEELIALWRRKADALDARAAEWDQKIAAAPDATNHQIGVWRGKATRCRREARSLREKIERRKRGYT